MGEEQGVTVDRAKLGDHPVDPLADLSSRFALGHAVAPERPARPLLPDVDRRPALVGPVVPLHQLVALHCSVAETGEPAGLRGAPERAREDEREVAVPERRANRLGLATALLGEGDVGAPRVLAGARPLGLAVPDDDDLVR
jgi:hypothetical protein